MWPLEPYAKIAVRIVSGEAEGLVDLSLDDVGQHMLEPVRLVMHDVERHSQRVREVQLEQPVMAKDLEGDEAASLGKSDPPIGRSLDELLLVELLRHRGDRRRRDAEPGRELVGARATCAALKLEDGLEEVLRGAGESSLTHGIRVLYNLI